MNNDIQLKLDVARKAGLVFSDLPWSTVRIGERLAGTILDEASGVIYDLMLIPGEMEKVSWPAAKAIALATGGDLPTRHELAILHANLELQFGEKTFWTNEVVQFEGVPGESCSYFSFDLGDCFDFTNQDDSMWALGVRRVPGGDAADLPPEQRPRNVVPAPAVPTKVGMSDSQLSATLSSVSGIIEVLSRLDGYMAANGYDANHPWRREIASASAGKSWGLPSAPAAPAPGIVAPDSGLIMEKMAKLVTMQRRACELLEATGFPGQVEAAGALRSATGDLWDAVREQVTINMLPSTLDNWMTTPAGLARVLVGALREERIDEPGEYNDAVEDCIVAVIGTLSAGAGADTAQKWAELSAMAPKVPVDDVAGVLVQLRGVADQVFDEDPTGVCRRAIDIIEGLLPHAGAGVQA
jgi:hypothetical protein